MTDDSDRNWWDFAVEPAVRADRLRSRFTGEMDVNPERDGGLRDLDYHRYLGLDRLLHCQTPSSRIPDERVFMITHQLMEIVFKMIVFDAAVTARTLEDFAGSGGPREALAAAEDGDEEYWRPAMTATARISFACGRLLPSIMRLLSDPKDADETFSSVEFYRFRENLEPGSGFQSAQFRLIQRALGKSNLLSVRLFPAQTYQRLYGVKTDETVTVVDPLILREDARVATPPPRTALDHVARLDDVAHSALAAIASRADAENAPPDKIHPSDIERAATLLERIVASRRKDVKREGPAGEPFRTDLRAAAERENARREGLRAAKAGGQILRRRAASSPLSRILNRLTAADEALHGAGQDSFLSVHLRVTRERLRQMRAYAAKMGEPEPTFGTGGGGVEYLGWVQRYLLPLFPALVAYREIGD
jgi:tryptophan 2,3-dioxygenase